MLPSGNDAAMVLAEHFGRYLVIHKAKTNYQSIK
jgi:D-alanyl-D-alanine carboxypeptidase